MRLHHRTFIIALAVVCLAAACSSGSHHATPTTQSRFAPTTATIQSAPKAAYLHQKPDYRIIVAVTPLNDDQAPQVQPRNLVIKAGQKRSVLLEITFVNQTSRSFEEAGVGVREPDTPSEAQMLEPNVCLRGIGDTTSPYLTKACHTSVPLQIRLVRGQYVVVLGGDTLNPDTVTDYKITVT